MDRRTFLALAGSAGVAAVLPSLTLAGENQFAMLDVVGEDGASALSEAFLRFPLPDLKVVEGQLYITSKEVEVISPRALREDEILDLCATVVDSARWREGNAQRWGRVSVSTPEGYWTLNPWCVSADKAPRPGLLMLVLVSSQNVWHPTTPTF